MVYFIRKPDGSAIKIGTAYCVSRRLDSLATAHGKGLKVLAVLSGSYDVESALHQRFAHLCLGGEWFEPGVDLLEYIATHGSSWDRDDATVKIDRGVLNMAQMVAKARKVSMAEYLSGLLVSPVRRDFIKEMERIKEEEQK